MSSTRQRFPTSAPGGVSRPKQGNDRAAGAPGVGLLAAGRRLTFAALALVACGVGAQPTAQPRNPSDPLSQTETEINLLKIEMQRLRSDIELMKGHVGRVVQYLQQRDAPGGTPQAGVPAPAQVPPPAAAAFNPAKANVSIAGAPTIGRLDAPVTIVEFSDFECQFCQRFFKTILPEIKRDYVDSGKVRYVFLDFPLEQIHFKARKAAEAAQCAAEQGKFWEMHEILFSQDGNLDLRQYGAYAKKLNLEAFAFELCLASGKQSVKIDRSLASGTSVGITATPSFIIARTERGDLINGGNIITGAQPYEQFRRAIEQALAGK